MFSKSLRNVNIQLASKTLFVELTLQCFLEQGELAIFLSSENQSRAVAITSESDSAPQKLRILVSYTGGLYALVWAVIDYNV